MTEPRHTYRIDEVPVIRYEGVCNTCNWRSPQQSDATSAHVVAHEHVLREHPVSEEPS